MHSCIRTTSLYKWNRTLEKHSMSWTVVRSEIFSGCRRSASGDSLKGNGNDRLRWWQTPIQRLVQGNKWSDNRSGSDHHCSKLKAVKTIHGVSGLQYQKFFIRPKFRHRWRQVKRTRGHKILLTSFTKKSSIYNWPLVDVSEVQFLIQRKSTLYTTASLWTTWWLLLKQRCWKFCHRWVVKPLRETQFRRR